MICLPEASDFIVATESHNHKHTEKLQDNDLVQSLLRVAKQNSVFISVGVHRPAPDGKLFNSHLLISPSGLQATNDKVHLFDVDVRVEMCGK